MWNVVRWMSLYFTDDMSSALAEVMASLSVNYIIFDWLENFQVTLPEAEEMLVT